MRPVLLTAGTTLLGNLIITLDPVFNGLALAIIFGIVASTLFTLLVVPAVYLLVYDDATIDNDRPNGGRTMNIKNGLLAAAGLAAC
jgi:Cu/Ag efflux pump CusA